MKSLKQVGDSNPRPGKVSTMASDKDSPKITPSCCPVTKTVYHRAWLAVKEQRKTANEDLKKDPEVSK